MVMSNSKKKFLSNNFLLKATVFGHEKSLDGFRNRGANGSCTSFKILTISPNSVCPSDMPKVVKNIL